MPLDVCPSWVAPPQWAPCIWCSPWWWWLKQLSLSEPGTAGLAEASQPAAWGMGMRFFFYLFPVCLFTSWSGKREGKFGGLHYIEGEGAVQSSLCNASLTQGRTIYRALHRRIKELQRKGSVTEGWMSTRLGTHSCEGQSEGLSCSVLPLCLALRGRDWWAPAEGPDPSGEKLLVCGEQWCLLLLLLLFGFAFMEVFICGVLTGVTFWERCLSLDWWLTRQRRPNKVATAALDTEVKVLGITCLYYHLISFLVTAADILAFAVMVTFLILNDIAMPLADNQVFSFWMPSHA